MVFIIRRNSVTELSGVTNEWEFANHSGSQLEGQDGQNIGVQIGLFEPSGHYVYVGHRAGHTYSGTTPYGSKYDGNLYKIGANGKWGSSVQLVSLDISNVRGPNWTSDDQANPATSDKIMTLAGHTGVSIHILELDRVNDQLNVVRKITVQEVVII